MLLDFVLNNLFNWEVCLLSTKAICLKINKLINIFITYNNIKIFFNINKNIFNINFIFNNIKIVYNINKYIFYINFILNNIKIAFNINKYIFYI